MSSPTAEQLREQSAARLKAQQEAFAKAQEENLAKASNTVKVEEHTYYSRVNGCTHIFKDGTVAVFTNGEYVTNRQNEIDELDELLKHRFNHLICKEKVPMQNPDGVHIMREVATSGVGMVSSAHLR